MIHVLQVIVGGFAVILTLCGAGLVGAGLAALRRSRAARHWPQAAGTIVASEVAADTRHEDSPMYRPTIRYRYAAPGGEFTADQLSATGRSYGRPGAARRVVEGFPVGRTVMVRYNPVNPAEALLEPGGVGGLWFILCGLLSWAFPVAVARAAGMGWSLITAILAGLIIVPGLLLRLSDRNLRRARASGLYPAPGTGSDAQVAALLARGEKILAIRLYRELHGGGLKEAKEAVEALGRDDLPPGTGGR